MHQLGPIRPAVLLAGAALGLLLLTACDEVVPGLSNAGELSGVSFIGDARRGAKEIARVGCGGCHTIPGITGANGLVGPPLTQMGRRIYLAGLLRNTPDNMMMWLREPQRVLPGNAMPNMDLKEEQARDIAAYLYTLR